MRPYDDCSTPYSDEDEQDFTDRLRLHEGYSQREAADVARRAFMVAQVQAATTVEDLKVVLLRILKEEP